MGSIRGQELGLGSGIVNMARQVGFAIGVALMVSVFTGTVDNRIADARRDVAALTRQAGLTQAESAQLRDVAFANPTDPGAPRVAARTPVEHRAERIVDEQVRDSFATAFRVAAFVTLLAIPFALTMRRRPSEVSGSQEGAAAAAAG
jgi:hypothetical protein